MHPLPVAWKLTLGAGVAPRQPQSRARTRDSPTEGIQLSDPASSSRGLLIVAGGSVLCLGSTPWCSFFSRSPPCPASGATPRLSLILEPIVFCGFRSRLVSGEAGRLSLILEPIDFQGSYRNWEDESRDSGIAGLVLAAATSLR